MHDRQAACRHDQASIPFAGKRCHAALDFVDVAHVDRAQLYPERWRSGLDYGELADPLGYARIPKDCRARHARCDLFEQFQPFCADAVLVPGKSGDVAPWPRQACDKPGADRIDGQREYNRHGAARLEQRAHARPTRGQDDVRRQRDQFRRLPAHAVGIARGPTGVDADVAAVGPAQFLQSLHERRHASL
jgi:hypothetical protein